MTTKQNYQDAANVGDVVRCWDHPKFTGSYVEGTVIEKGDILNRNGYYVSGYKVAVETDTVFTKNPRQIVLVPFYDDFDIIEDRVENLSNPN